MCVIRWVEGQRNSRLLAGGHHGPGLQPTSAGVAGFAQEMAVLGIVSVHGFFSLGVVFDQSPRPCGSGRMQACVQAEVFRRFEREHALRAGHIDHQVPRARADHAGHQQKRMHVEQGIAKGLLACAYRARTKPCRVGDGVQVKPVDQVRPGNFNPDQLVRHRVQDPKRFMHRDFQNRGRGVQATVDDPPASGRPAPAYQKGPFPLVPRSSMPRRIQTPL